MIDASVRDWTIVVMVWSCAVLIGWDLYVAFFNKVDNQYDTISGIILGWSESIWILPYAFGAFGGHLFWPALGGPILGEVWSVPTLLASALLIAGIGWRFRASHRGWTLQGPILLVFGVFAGHWLWPQ